MKSHRVEKYKSIRKDGGLYQSENPFIKWYFYKRLDIALKLSEISKEDAVCEVGCQEGFFLPSLVKNADKIFACDIDESVWGSVLSFSKKLLITELGKDAIKKVALFYADASHLPFEDKSLDIVFILDCIEHMSYPTNKLAIYEAWRVLKYDGVLIVSLPIEKGIILLLREIIRRMLIYPGPRYSFKELIKAAIYNETAGEWNNELAGHEGYDYSRDFKIIKDLFGEISISYAPFPFLRNLNPTVVIKAKKSK